jgi:dipeptidase E
MSIQEPRSKLILYSGGQTSKNHRLHRELAALAGGGKNLSMTYIPSESDGSESFYRRAKSRYEPFGFSRFVCLPVDQALNQGEIQRALRSDVIYMAGGNTFYLLKHLKKSGVFSRLKAYSQRGGVLGGLSAGALVLTPSIFLAGYPEHDADDNDVGLKDLKALGLAPFEFFPHLDRDPRTIKKLTQYSERSPGPILGAPDGSGVVVVGDQVRAIGTVSLWLRGQRWKIRGESLPSVSIPRRQK